MKELNKFRKFLSEDLEEGIFDFIKKSAPKEDPTPEDEKSEPKLPDWVLVYLRDGKITSLKFEKFIEGIKKQPNTKWANSPSDYLEILATIPGAQFIEVTPSLGQEIFNAQQKDKSKTTLKSLGVSQENIKDIALKAQTPGAGGKLELPKLGAKSLEDLKFKGDQGKKMSDEEYEKMIAQTRAEEEGIEEVVLFKDRSQDFQLDVIAQQMFRSNFRELDVDQQEDVRDKLESMDLNETRDPEVYNMADNLVEYLGEKGFIDAILAAMSTDDAKLYLSAIMRDYDLGGMEMNEEMDLGEKAKVFFLQMLKRGEIDTLPTNPKEEYIRMMMRR